MVRLKTPISFDGYLLDADRKIVCDTDQSDFRLAEDKAHMAEIVAAVNGQKLATEIARLVYEDLDCHARKDCLKCMAREFLDAASPAKEAS